MGRSRGHPYPCGPSPGGCASSCWSGPALFENEAPIRKQWQDGAGAVLTPIYVTLCDPLEKESWVGAHGRRHPPARSRCSRGQGNGLDLLPCRPGAPSGAIGAICQMSRLRSKTEAGPSGGVCVEPVKWRQQPGGASLTRPGEQGERMVNQRSVLWIFPRHPHSRSGTVANSLDEGPASCGARARSVVERVRILVEAACRRSSPPPDPWRCL